jgi:hypothetical protein
VLRFDGMWAFIQNPNFVEPDPNAPKAVGFFWGLGDLKSKKEFRIPKDYLRKVDDNLAVTVSTGILYGANMKPQPVYDMPPIKIIPQVSSDVILEENASFVLNSDFQYISGYSSIGGGYNPNGFSAPIEMPKYSILKAGTKVTGRLFKTITSPKKNIFSTASVMPNAVERDFLAVKGYGNTGSINIPIEYLTREVTTNTNNNNGVVLPVEDNNKNLLMILGAFLVGYLLFNNDTPTT